MTTTGGALRRPALSYVGELDELVLPRKYLYGLLVDGRCWLVDDPGGGTAPRYWCDKSWWSLRKLMWIAVNGPLGEYTTSGAQCRNRMCVKPSHTIRTSRRAESISRPDVPESLSYLEEDHLRPTLYETHNAILRLSEDANYSQEMCWIEFLTRVRREAHQRSSSKASSPSATLVQPSTQPSSSEQSRPALSVADSTSDTSTSAPGRAGSSEHHGQTSRLSPDGIRLPSGRKRPHRMKPMQQPSPSVEEDFSAEEEEEIQMLVSLANELEPREYRMRNWVADAACSDADSTIFFANSHSTAIEVYCDACPVQIRCLAFALHAPMTYGVWGGLTAQQRDRYGMNTQYGGDW